MIWLLLSIISSTAIMVVFKLFKKYEISTLHAIVINYYTAALIGLLFINDINQKTQAFDSWLPFALLLGTLFIGLFFLIGVTTQKMGINVSTIAMKLGYILPIILAFSLYQEHISTIKFIGIALTLFALIFSSIKINKVGQTTQKWLFLFPIIIFVGSGISDAIVQYAEKTYFPKGNTEFFIIILFITAGTIGFLASLIQFAKKKEWLFNKKNILGGIILGIPNYFSIYFLFKTLNAFPAKSVVVFPANNIGIVMLSTLLAIVFFKEKLSPLNIVGFILAIISIILMYYENIVLLF
ncbi:MAG: EamA family transporter [Bacteroidetes bacterium]|nr:EamA family transporter [Bacteroidota bacterium]MCB9227906.1 EamA family transporter [Chitinophagales bacterium]